MKYQFKYQSWMSPVIVLVVWQIVASAGLVETRFFPAPSAIFAKFTDMVTTAQFWIDLKISVVRLLVGFAIGAIPGAAIGLLMGLSPLAERVVSPLISMLYPLPKIALLPLIMLIFGLSEASKYAIVAIGVFFIMAINTYGGVQNINKIYFDVAKNLKVPGWKVYLTVALPGALPGIFTGLRLATGVALILLVSAEFVGASEGIGYRIWWSWTVFWVEQMYVGLVIIALLGFGFASLVGVCERTFLPWRRGGR